VCQKQDGCFTLADIRKTEKLFYRELSKVRKYLKVLPV
jgi:hypothetical protein